MAITEPDFIDPSRASNRPGLFVLKQICDPLVALDPASGQLAPGAAESWELSPGATKITFKLRPRMKFHNTREVVAGDYVYSMTRFARKDSGSRQHFLLERVAGYRELRDGPAETLSGVKAPDPLTLEVELAEPFAEIASVFAHPAAGSAVPKEEVDKGAEAFAANPVCTGPYSLASPWERGGDIRLARSAPYTPYPAVWTRSLGYSQEIVMSVVPDALQGYERLGRGEVLVAEVPVERLSEARRIAGRLESAASGVLSFIGLPVTRAPFDNRDFRVALALAIDRSEIIRGLLADSREMPAGFLPATAGPVGSDQACLETVKPRGDPAAASAALQSSGIDPAATGIKIHFNDGGSGHENWLTIVADQWNGVLGVSSTLNSQEWGAYLDFLVDGADGPFRLAWPVEYPSAEALFAPLLGGGSLDNYTRFANPQFDDALKRARATVDETDRRRIYLEAADVLCQQMPIIPMWFAQSHVGFHPSIVGAGETRVDIFGDPVLRELGKPS